MENIEGLDHAEILYALYKRAIGCFDICISLTEIKTDLKFKEYLNKVINDQKGYINFWGDIYLGLMFDSKNNQLDIGLYEGYHGRGSAGLILAMMRDAIKIPDEAMAVNPPSKVKAPTRNSQPTRLEQPASPTLPPQPVFAPASQHQGVQAQSYSTNRNGKPPKRRRRKRGK